MTTTNKINNVTCSITDSGSVAWCGVGAASSAVTGSGEQYTVTYSSDSIGRFSALNTGTGIMTAPATGYYLMGAAVSLQGMFTSGTVNLFLNVNGTNYTICTGNALLTVSADAATYSGSLCVQMTSGQSAKVIVQVTGLGTVVNVNGSSPKNTYFYGALIK